MHGTSVTIQRELGITGHFWEKSYHSRRILDDVDLVATIAYDHLNPVEAEMASAPEKYGRSSARWWRDRADTPIPHCAGAVPFECSYETLRGQILEYQASRAFLDAMAEFAASGEVLGTKRGLDVLKKVLFDRGLLREGADTGVRGQTTQALSGQRLAAEETRT